MVDERSGRDAARPCRASERVFVVGGLHGTLPGAVEPRQHLLRRRVSGLYNAVERFEMTGLVAPGMIDAAAPAQARMRQGKAFLGNLEDVAVPDRGLEAEP